MVGIATIDRMNDQIKKNPESVVPEQNPLKIRHDNEDFVILVNWEHRIWLCASANVVDILKLCDGKKTAGEVAREYAAIFPDVNPEIVIQDVLNVLTKSVAYKLVRIKGGENSGESSFDGSACAS